jgi:hypothetical protein
VTNLQFQLTLDAADPRALGQFWALALGYIEEPPPGDFADWDAALDAWGVPPQNRNEAYAIIDAAEDGSAARPRIFLQRVPEPKTAKNRLHIDIDSGAGRPDSTKDWDIMRSEAQRLATAGATVLREFDESVQGQWIVMNDPEGNEFCVC